MGRNPSHCEGANRPVENVRFFDALLFCNVLSEKEGLDPVYIGGTVDASNLDDLDPEYDYFEDLGYEEIKWVSEGIHFDQKANGYRLLTDAEWECAARGGEDYLYSGSNNVEDVAWTGRSTRVVGMKKPNGFGFYDMSGNVDEWCWDAWDSPFYLRDGEKEAFRIDPINDSDDFSDRMMRGGYRPNHIILSNRYSCEAWKRYSSIGIRIARNSYKL